MKKRIVTLCGIGLFIMGLLVLFNATNIGVNIANKAIQAYGGSMDTEEFYFIMKSHTLSYQIGGAIIALVGGLSSILIGYINIKNDVKSF